MTPLASSKNPSRERLFTMAFSNNINLKSNPLRHSLMKTQAVLLTLLLLFFLINLLSRYPGEYGTDSIDQYRQAVAFRFDDLHPPIAAWLWSYVRLVADGFGPIFTLQIALYWLGFGIIVIAFGHARHFLTAWCVLGVAVFPWCLMMNINLGKDVGMAVTFLCAFAMIFWSRVRNKKISVLVGSITAAFLFYGTLVRTNAVFAVIPLLAYCLYPRTLAHPWRLLFASVPVALLLIPLSTAFNHNILKAASTNQAGQLQVFDLAGIAYYSGDMSVFGAGNSFTEAEVQRCYTPILHESLAPWGKCSFFWARLVNPHWLKDQNEFASVEVSGPVLDLMRKKKMDEWFEAYERGKTPIDHELARLWLSAIAKHPIAYLQHRFAHFNSQLFFWVPSHHADPRVTYAFVLGTKLDFATQPMIKRLTDVLRNNVFTTPAFWLVTGSLLFVLLASARSSGDARQHDAALALTSSALLYTAAYGIIGITTDHRFNFWSIMATFIAVVISMPEWTERFRLQPRLAWASAGIIGITICMILAARLSGGDALYPNA